MSKELLIPLDNIENDTISIEDNKLEVDKIYFTRIIFTTLFTFCCSILYCSIGYYYISIYHLCIPISMYFINTNNHLQIDIFLFSNLLITILDLVYIFILSTYLVEYLISIIVFTSQFISLVTIHNYRMRLVNI